MDVPAHELRLEATEPGFSELAYPRAPAGPRIEILGPAVPRSAEALTPLALQLLASLHRRFNARRLELLNARRDRQIQLRPEERRVGKECRP